MPLYADKIIKKKATMCHFCIYCKYISIDIYIQSVVLQKKKIFFFDDIEIRKKNKKKKKERRKKSKNSLIVRHILRYVRIEATQSRLSYLCIVQCFYNQYIYEIFNSVSELCACLGSLMNSHGIIKVWKFFLFSFILSFE